MEGPLLRLQFCPDPLTNMAASQLAKKLIQQ
jgi:hypothetical protein